MRSASAGPTVHLIVGSVASENETELRGFSTSSFITNRSGIVVIVESWNSGHCLLMCRLVFSTAAS